MLELYSFRAPAEHASTRNGKNALPVEEEASLPRFHEPSSETVQTAARAPERDSFALVGQFDGWSFEAAPGLIAVSGGSSALRSGSSGSAGGAAGAAEARPAVAAAAAAAPPPPSCSCYWKCATTTTTRPTPSRGCWARHSR